MARGARKLAARPACRDHSRRSPAACRAAVRGLIAAEQGARPLRDRSRRMHCQSQRCMAAASTRGWVHATAQARWQGPVASGDKLAAWLAWRSSSRRAPAAGAAAAHGLRTGAASSTTDRGQCWPVMHQRPLALRCYQPLRPTIPRLHQHAVPDGTTMQTCSHNIGVHCGRAPHGEQPAQSMPEVHTPAGNCGSACAPLACTGQGATGAPWSFLRDTAREPESPCAPSQACSEFAPALGLTPSAASLA